jgi:signal transduction histidine kinase
VLKSYRGGVASESDEAVTAFADEVYDLARFRLYSQVIRAFAQDRYWPDGAFDLDAQMEAIAREEWEDRDADEPAHFSMKPRSEAALVGVGAPTHVFLGEVARAMGAPYAVPEHARVANAVGAAVSRITVEQQAHEMEVVRQNEQSLRLMRHDMRHFLNSLTLCIQDGDREKALKMVASYSSRMDGIPVNRFCDCETVNYVLSHFAAKCTAQNIDFSCDVALVAMEKDEILFCSILQNALENAFNAQLLLPPEKRQVRLLLKTMGNKLLLAVKNPFDQMPVFSDGLPVSNKPDHGYGTQSIRYTTERLGGNCQFTVQDGLFVLRVIL